MAEICVKAVLAVADLDRKDVNLDLIKVCVTGAARPWALINRSKRQPFSASDSTCISSRTTWATI